jgi:hypothetical protein
MKVFKESQRFNQWWLILFGLITVIFIGLGFVSEYNDSGGNLSNDQLISMIISGSLMVIVFLLIGFIRLKTKIDENGITYQFTPFHFTPRIIPWSDLSKCYIRKYSPITEYGGWGIRGLQRKGFWDFGNKGMAYNIKGDMGIQLEFKDGGKLLIGTQDPDKAKKTIQTYISKMG